MLGPCEESVSGVGMLLGIRGFEFYMVRDRTYLPSITQPIPQQIALYKKALTLSPNHEYAAENLKIDEQRFVDRGQAIPGVDPGDGGNPRITFWGTF